ncbi:MAG TPA: hypothetical protein ENI65_01055 [Gammaproteobacteria bacterium]|nr:hypothetical protein [Gammaproteobacteria bacterium]
MESAGLIKTVCRTDAAAEPPWMACFACLDQACRFHVRIAQFIPKRTSRLNFNYIRHRLTDSSDSKRIIHLF